MSETIKYQSRKRYIMPMRTEMDDMKHLCTSLHHVNAIHNYHSKQCIYVVDWQLEKEGPYNEQLSLIFPE